MFRCTVSNETWRYSRNHIMIRGMYKVDVDRCSTVKVGAQQCWHGSNLWLTHGRAIILIKTTSIGMQVAEQSTMLPHTCHCTSITFVIPRRAGIMFCFAWAEMAKMSSSLFKMWQRSSWSKFPASRPVRIWTIVCKAGKDSDVCSSRKVMINSVVLSAAVEEDVEPWAVSSMGCLIMII